MKRNLMLGLIILAMLGIVAYAVGNRANGKALAVAERAVKHSIPARFEPTFADESVERNDNGAYFVTGSVETSNPGSQERLRQSFAVTLRESTVRPGKWLVDRLQFGRR